MADDLKRDAWLDFFSKAPESLRKNFGPAFKVIQENPEALERTRQQVKEFIVNFDALIPNPEGELKAFRDSADYLLRLLEEGH